MPELEASAGNIYTLAVKLHTLLKKKEKKEVLGSDLHVLMLMFLQQ